MECSTYSTLQLSINYKFLLNIDRCAKQTTGTARIQSGQQAVQNSARMSPSAKPNLRRRSAPPSYLHTKHHSSKKSRENIEERQDYSIGAHSFLTNFYIPHTHGQKSHGTVSLIYSGGQGFFYDFTIYVHCTLYSIYTLQ